MIQATLPKRGTDDWGNGEFHASRGTKNGKPKYHKGIDYACYPETIIKSTVKGKVSKIGYAYNDDLTFRYVEITDDQENRHRIFYIRPTVRLNMLINCHMEIGLAQNIAGRYTTSTRIMKNHIHYEIFNKNNKLLNPELFL